MTLDEAKDIADLPNEYRIDELQDAHSFLLRKSRGQKQRLNTLITEINLRCAPWKQPNQEYHLTLQEQQIFNTALRHKH